MIYIVEIQGPNGTRATKEYEASSIRGALRSADLDLLDYPHTQITDIHRKPEWDMPVSSDQW